MASSTAYCSHSVTFRRNHMNSKRGVLILVNLEINCKKNRQCISITNHSTCHFAQEKKNHISNGLCSYALVYSYYRYSQLFRHTSLLTLAGERAAWVLLMPLKINRD